MTSVGSETPRIAGRFYLDPMMNGHGSTRNYTEEKMEIRGMPVEAVIPANAGIQPFNRMDDSLRSPYGPPLQAFNALRALSGMRRNDGRRFDMKYSRFSFRVFPCASVAIIKNP